MNTPTYTPHTRTTHKQKRKVDDAAAAAAAVSGWRERERGKHFEQEQRRRATSLPRGAAKGEREVDRGRDREGERLLAAPARPGLATGTDARQHQPPDGQGSRAERGGAADCRWAQAATEACAGDKRLRNQSDELSPRPKPQAAPPAGVSAGTIDSLKAAFGRGYLKEARLHLAQGDLPLALENLTRGLATVRGDHGSLRLQLQVSPPCLRTPPDHRSAYFLVLLYAYVYIYIRAHAQDLHTRSRQVSSSSYDMYPPPHMTCMLYMRRTCTRISPQK